MRPCEKSLLLTGSLLFVSASFPAAAAWHAVGKVEAVSRVGNALILSTADGARVQVSMPTPDVVRVRMTPRASFEHDVSYAIQPQQQSAIELLVEDDATGGTVALHGAKPGGARVLVQKSPHLSIAIYDAQGRAVVVDDPLRPMAYDPETGAVETSKQRSAKELYYGFGEKSLPLSRHQQYMTMWNSDTPNYAPGLDPLYQTIPFFIALREGAGYGLFFDNTYRSFFDMGKTDPARYTFGASGGELNYYVFTGGQERSPAAILRDYSALTGRGALPPLWALGYQQSRYSYTPDARVSEIARTFRSKRIPADAIYLDIDYMDGYRIFSWSKKDFPHPEKLLGELRDEGFHVITIVDPGIKVDEGYSIYRDGRDRVVFTRDAQGGELHAVVWPGMCAFPDFTNPQARAWFGSLYSNFLDQGVSGFWNDMNEPATFPPPNPNEPLLAHDPGKTFPLDAQHNGDDLAGNHARYHNIYGMQMARATFEGVRKLRPQNRPFVLTRAGYAGVQRYAAVWTGDNVASWEHLALTIPMLTNLSISGVPFVGADVGGFVGSPSAELYTRWLQAAALTPLFRTHAEINSKDREPWSYGDRFERINRATIELRYQLLPYIYTVFAQNEADGRPLLRPVWFDYPNDAKTLQLDDEFLLGHDLLVAPVVHEGSTHRKVYFPRGDAWLDWWDGARHEGGTFADVPAPLERLPLFLRVGAIVPSQATIQHTGEMLRTPLTLTVALGADGVGSVYQDAGEGYAYRTGDSRTSQITLRGDELTLKIPAPASFQRIGFVEFVGLATAPKQVTADGKILSNVAFDAKSKRARFALPDENVHTISVQR
jgi:alpha-glucosidase